MRTIKVRVQPRSSVEKVDDKEDGTLKIYTHKPAIDGEANKAVIRILSDHFGIKKNKIIIEQGDKSRDKIIKILD